MYGVETFEAFFFCAFPFLPSFRGFPNLLSLYMYCVKFASCGSFIALCPKLENLRIIDHDLTCHVKFDVILKLVNLKVLSLSMGSVFDKTTPVTSSGFIQLLCLLPNLQKLELDFMAFKFIAEAPDASIYKKIPNAFLCLRNLELSEVDFRCDNFLSFVVEMICGSPNMQTLMIKATRKDNLIAYARSSLDFDHNKIGQLQLQNVYIDNYRGLTNENHLIKYILACSPLLKKIVIKPFDDNGKNNSQMFWFAEKLLTFPRVSRVAKIYLHGYLDY